MQRRGFTLIEALVVLLVVAFLAAILMPPGCGRGRHNAHRSACQNNLKKIAIAVLQYSSHYDEVFPSPAQRTVSTSVAPFEAPYGWADVIQPYLQNITLLQCPAEYNTASSNDGVRNGFTDYWMNPRMSRMEYIGLTNPTRTLLCGDGNDGTETTNARYNLKSLPARWRNDPNAPSQRHLERANYLFADGHVKALKFGQISQQSPGKAPYTFAPR